MTFSVNDEKIINKILILGNSITSHGPAPDIGWSGNWGMAASSQEFDYVNRLRSVVPTDVEIEIFGRNSLVSVTGFDFERNFSEVILKDFLEDARVWQPDIILIAYGENFDSNHPSIDSLDFHLKRLVDYLIDDRNDVIVCLKNNFWPENFSNLIINQKIAKACTENGYLLADISDLQLYESSNECLREPRENNAVGLFSHCGLALHPSDLGMKRIFEAFWGQIGCIFNQCFSRLDIEAPCSIRSISGNKIYHESGQYYDTLTSSNNLDSIVTTYFTKKITKLDTLFSVVACSPFTSPSKNYTWTHSGTYYDTIPNSHGCDSLITIELNVLDTKSILRRTTCPELVSPSKQYTWTKSGSYYDTIPNSHGCDSIINVIFNLECAIQNINQSRETNTLQVFPIPSLGEITFKINEQFVSIATLEIINISGKRLIFQMFNRNSIVLNELPQGTYFYQVKARNSVRHGKFIIQ